MKDAYANMMRQVASTILVSAGVLAAVPAAATSVKSVELGELFREADVVAHVHITSGQTECHDVAVYRGEVLTPLKNVATGDAVYFGPYSSYRVGGEYLLFLRDSNSTLIEHQRTETTEPCPQYPSAARYRVIMHAGYGSLPIKYTRKIPDGDHGVRVVGSRVVLPATLESFPLTSKYAGTSDDRYRWVRKEDMLNHLATLSAESEALAPIEEMEVVTSGEEFEFARLGCGFTCPHPLSIRMAANRASLIFTGTVESIKNETWELDSDAPEPTVEDISVFQLAVTSTFKGDTGDRVEVRTRWQGLCGFEMDAGREYVVYAYQTGGELWTEPIMRTAPLDAVPGETRKLRRRFRAADRP